MNPTGINFGWTCSRQPQETESQLLSDNYATNIENMDNLRVEELNQLSKEERERAQHEVHCVVDDPVDEEPEYVERLLAQMEDEISKNRKKFAYDRALFLSPSYVRDRNFALMFLRSTYFHPSKAAECMIAHFELKLELFGLECLARAVTLEDLNEEDIVTLETGNCQCLSEKDRGGRAVFCGLYKVQHDTTRQRTNFYQTMVALEDVETQKRGIVLVLFSHYYEGHHTIGMERLRRSQNFLRGLPFKFMGVHNCCSQESMPFFLPFQNVIQYLIGSDGRRHFRTQCGSTMEIKFKLLSFGIPMDHFPIDDDSKLLGLTDFCERRRTIENARRVEQDSRILAPGKLDILLGRGKPMQEWLGNLQLGTTLVANADLHNSTAMNRRGAKNDLSHDIVENVKDSGGRFLKRQKGDLEWIEVDDVIAREKVNNGFRNKGRQFLTKPTSSGNTRKAGLELSDTSIDPVEECIGHAEELLSHPPNILDGGGISKRPRTTTMDTAPPAYYEDKTASQLPFLQNTQSKTKPSQELCTKGSSTCFERMDSQRQSLRGCSFDASLLAPFPISLTVPSDGERSLSYMNHLKTNDLTNNEDEPTSIFLPKTSISIGHDENAEAENDCSKSKS